MNLLDKLLPGIAEATSIHPMLVHFPAALLPVAFVLAALAWRRYPQLWLSTRLVLAFGALGSVAAVATGLIAQEGMPHGPGSLVAVHRTFMLIATGLTIAVTLFAFSGRLIDSRRRQLLLLAGLALVNGVVVLGADRGALVSARLGGGGREPGVPAGAAEDRAAEVGTTGDGAASSLPPGDANRGHALWEALECASCHSSEGRKEAPGIPPTLEHAGSMLDPSWTGRYLMDPHRIRWVDENKRPVQRMPDFDLDPQEASDLAEYLAGREATEAYPGEPVATPFTAEEVEEGRGLYDEYACKNCHVLGGAGIAFGPALDGAGDRLQPAYTYALLMKPRAVIPGTPMKDFGLWEEEGRALTAYVTSLRRVSAAPDSLRP